VWQLWRGTGKGFIDVKATMISKPCVPLVQRHNVRIAVCCRLNRVLIIYLISYEQYKRKFMPSGSVAAMLQKNFINRFK
jgi:hypothetical protein